MAFISVLCLAAVCLALLLVNHKLQQRVRRLSKDVRPLPGPKGLPFIGNVHELPAQCSWMKFHEWGEKYGPIYQVNLAGTNHVWISRDSIARDLLSKRSAIYSDRPFIPALEQDNRTSGQYLPLMSQNELWARQRKFAKKIMDTSQKSSFYGYPELESIRLLFELMTDPSHYNVAMESFISRVTCRLAWGTPAASDELKQRARELLIGVSPSGALGNKLPAIMSLPEKLAPAKAWELRRNRTERKFFETMQQEVEDGMSGKCQSKPSWMRTFLDNKLGWGFEKDLEGAYAVGMHGIAGALTIAAPMQSLCLALCHYPQHQPILHEEIDRVLGDRMPTFEDMPDMPVLRAFIRETMRWRPPVPTGIPHELIQDDIYEGYHIPAGSVMHPLEWSISRDPEVFPEPDEWNPTRWLDSSFPTYQEPLTKYPTITQYSQFGYGRRNCQGMGVTEADLFVGLGSVAWLFSLQKAPDDNEAVVMTDPEKEETPASEDVPEVHEETFAERAFFEENAERIKRQSWDYFRNPSAGSVEPQSPSSESPSCETPPYDHHVIEGAKAKLTIHANDSAIDMPDDFPVLQTQGEVITPPPTPKERTRRRETVSIRVPGSYPFEPHSAPALALAPAKAETTKKVETPYGLAPYTMKFSTLLIAKPLPFKFELKIRNKERAQKVAREWLDLKMKGEFEESRIYWGGGKDTRGDAEYGWGEVFS